MPYIPRTSILIPNDMTTNPVYNGWNWYDNNGYGIWANGGNCTAYCYGRFWEPHNPVGIDDDPPRVSHYDAFTWYGNIQDGYQRGQVPKLGAIACWSNSSTPGEGGHVAIIEKIYNDGSYDISESGYHAFIFQYTRIYDNNYGSNYSFQGFIYNPYVDDSGGPINPLLFYKLKKRREDYGRKFMAPSGLPFRK